MSTRTATKPTEGKSADAPTLTLELLGRSSGAQLSTLLSGFDGRGWRETDDSALRLLEALKRRPKGATPKTLAGIVSGTFLGRNGITRRQAETFFVDLIERCQRERRRAARLGY